MIPFFPTLYENELLYSGIARYHIRMGNISPKSTIRELFGSTTICSSVELPSGIDRLISNLPVGSTLTADEMINHHTLYPFFSAFLPREQAERIYQSMRGDDGKDIYNRAGLMASSIKANVFFKYCPLCAKEQQENGQMYWNRIQQIPGMICVKHGAYLEDSTVMIKQGNKHIFILPNQGNCPTHTVRHVTSKDILAKYRSLLNDIEVLLQKKFPYRSLQLFYRCYKERLKLLGFANAKGRIDHSKLQRAFIDYYGMEFLEKLQCSITYNGGWLAEIARKHRKTFHPIRHLLFIRFLGLSLEEVFYQDDSYRPFGEAPYPCLNVCCRDYRRDVIAEVQITICGKTKQPIGTFSCQKCGFVYTRKGIQKSEADRFVFSRVKQYGQVWQNEVDRLVKEQMSFRQIAKRVNADVGTVIKYAQKFERVTTSIEKSMEINYTYRDAWLQLQNQYPFLSKSELRKLAPKIYIWLYRNDRSFLMNCSPKRKDQPIKQKRVDWDSRDIEMLEKIQREVKRLMGNEGKPERITISKIGSLIGHRNVIERHLDKMPLTKAYLETVIETQGSFKVKRIRWAISELLKEGETLVDWKIYRKASVRPSEDLDINEIIENLC